MADATKYAPINGGTLISDLKSQFSIRKTQRAVGLAYGFVFVFVAFTVFLAFSPSSNSSSPWFTNIFTSTSAVSSSGSSSSSSSAIFSEESYRSHFSSIFSYFFPNSSQEINNATSLPSSSPAPRSQNAALQSSNLQADFPIVENQTRVTALHDKFPNQTPKASNATLQPPDTNNQSSAVENQTQNKDLSSKSEGLSTNTSVIQDPKSPSVMKQPTTTQDQTQNKDSQGKGEASIPNQSTIHTPKSPAGADRSWNPAQNSSSQGMNTTGNPQKVLTKEGVLSNFTSSLSRKQSNGSNSGVSAKQGTENLVERLLKCNLYDGKWIRDDSYPLYKPGSCSLIDEQFNCFQNGRPDGGYQKFKWKPNGCSIPRMDGGHMLELLRGKRLVLMGDSLNRNMWESLVCILRNSAKDLKKVYEASGRHHFRTEASYSFIFEDYNCSVEFFVAPFLVQEWEVPDKNGKKETLRLDIIERSVNQCKNADIVIFNTGHWWTHDKTSKGKDYYQEGSHVYDELNVVEAFRRALTTWGRWVDANVNPAKTHVLFRGYSASHFSGGQWNSGGQCDHETEPIKNETYLTEYPPKMVVLEKVLKGMKTRVSYLNITRMTDYRKDGHPSIYRKQNLSGEERKSPLRFQDCSHWCLPGVPDAWNELLYAELLIEQYKKQLHQQQNRS